MKPNINIIHGAEAKMAGSNAGQDETVRCLTLNFFSYKMLLPNAAVAEVTGATRIEPRLGAPEWFGGMTKWREQEVPVVVFEKVMNIAASKPQSYRRYGHQNRWKARLPQVENPQWQAPYPAEFFSDIHHPLRI